MPDDHSKPTWTMDDVGGNERRAARIRSLHPVVQDRMVAAMNHLKEEGIPVLIADTYRSAQEQQKLYDSGRDVTGKPGGLSYHNHGLAFDLVPADEKGKPTWEPKDPAVWGKIADTVRKHGFVWGSDPGATSIGKDHPHHQYAAYPDHEMSIGLKTQVERANGNPAKAHTVPDEKGDPAKTRLYPVLPNEPDQMRESAAHLAAFRSGQRDGFAFPFSPSDAEREKAKAAYREFERNMPPPAARATTPAGLPPEAAEAARKAAIGGVSGGESFKDGQNDLPRTSRAPEPGANREGAHHR